MLKCFIGFDPRQPIAYQVLHHSIVTRASVPVSITPLVLKQLPVTRRGLTEFTFSRFLVPFLCGYEGTALFLDADMLVTGDIAELFALADPQFDVQVMREQPKFEWASAMLFDCARCKILTPEYIDDTRHNPLTLDWATTIGDLPPEWNHCVGYMAPRNDAKLYHYTKGVPVWRETQNNREDTLWYREHKAMNGTVSYQELMGGSVHARTA